MTAPVVTVYTATACPQCTATKQHLVKLGIPFTEAAIDDQTRAAAAELGITSAPIVCASVDGEERWWGGYRPDSIKALVSAA
ncbi:glutaredoxin family protein [Mycobacterium sp. 48b]|uniref:glutaredoxin family protein n=1 Tax=Mycobacterium sp. 48b TaxID=3400426 RepID=UPI003AB09AD7